MIAIFPELEKAAAAADVERLAVLVRRYFGGDAPYAQRLDVLALARRAGLAIERLRPDARAAVVARDHRGSFRVALLIDPAMDHDEVQFTAAHLMGHVLLDILPLIARGDFTVSGYRETHGPLRRYAQATPRGGFDPDERREARADQFAAAVLMPAGMVRRAFEKLADERRTAAFFGVSPACLARRLLDLRVRTAAPASFLEAEARLAPSLGENGGAEHLVEVAPPMETPAMPRGAAAASYDQTARITRRQVSAELPASRAPAVLPHESSQGLTPARQVPGPRKPGPGLERLRSIARSLDKSVP